MSRAAGHTPSRQHTHTQKEAFLYMLIFTVSVARRHISHLCTTTQLGDMPPPRYIHAFTYFSLSQQVMPLLPGLLFITRLS